MLIISIALVCGMATAQEEKASNDEEFTLEEIVVTGSRIPRRDYSSSSPIVTVKAETFEDRSNIGIESALNQLPLPNTSAESSAVRCMGLRNG